MSNNEVKYVHSPSIHNTVASDIVVPILIDLFSPNSVLDVGCGLGTWLKSFADCGVSDIFGVDGDYVNRHLLSLNIPLDKFLPLDLTNPFDLYRKFDLVISLEVAEHLPEIAAKDFVRSLTSHGDIIVFSAAIPNQGGQNHLNEQWKIYWINLFEQHGYRAFDLIRPLIWEMSGVEYWYKQNILVYSKQDLSFPKRDGEKILEAVHPEMFAAKLEWLSHYVNGLHDKILELEKKIDKLD